LIVKERSFKEIGTLKPENQEAGAGTVESLDRDTFYRKYHEMLDHAGKLATIIKEHEVIKVITHIDADGIAAGSIATQALERAGKEWTVQFEKQLDPIIIKKLHIEFESLVGNGVKGLFWFTDFGSGQVPELEGINYIITDHHLPAVEGAVVGEKAETREEGSAAEAGVTTENEEKEGGAGMMGAMGGVENDDEPLPSSQRSGQTSLFDFYQEQGENREKETSVLGPSSSEERVERELNPHVFGLSGADHISGAGVTYLVAKALDEENEDLAALAVLGAVGDLQDTGHCRLVGLNEFIVEDAGRHGLRADYDIRSFGRETRPIFKLLQYTNDPIIPSLTGDAGNAMAFMVFCKEPLAEGMDPQTFHKEEMGVNALMNEQQSGQNWKKWVDLGWESKQTVLSNIVKLLFYKGISRNSTLRLLGEVYVFENEVLYTPLRSAKEFATLLNACGRYGNADIGFKVCLGDRGRFFEKALLLLKGHRRVLVDNIKYVQDTGVVEREYIQYFHGEDVIPENVVGIVAGMILGSGDVNENLPIIGFANTSEGIKVSGRTVRKVVIKGVNLAKALNKASKDVGGGGGGHNIAAGAHIPKGKEGEFLALLEDVIRQQLEGEKKE